MKEPSMFWGLFQPLIVGIILGLISLPYNMPMAIAIILGGSLLNSIIVHLLRQ